MDEREKRREKILVELAERFNHSSEIMRQVAKRISEAAATSKANKTLLDQASGTLRGHMGVKNASLPFSYREFLEFSSAEEFERFRDLAPINEDDIRKMDWDALADDFLKDGGR
ncbi:MAG: hypothetical protein LBU64_09560 [Planctomycetota bacterium]|jgi:hypothetical protein|nr:hypothetical protein [Planctomycetota bacterium]